MFNCSSTNERQQCSDHGYYCDEIFNQGCICDVDYWSSSSNVSPQSLQCDVHIAGAYTFECFCVATCVASSLIISRAFIIPYFMGQVSYRTITKDKSKFLFPLVFFIAIMFNLAEAIGNLLICCDSYISLLIGPFFVFFGQFGFVLYFFMVLKFLKSCNGYISRNLIIETNKFDTMIYNLAFLAYLIPPVSFCFCLISLVGMPVTKYRSEFIKVFITGSGTLALISGLLITYAFRFVLIYLEEHTRNFDQTSDEIQIVYRRLRRNYYVCGLVSAAVGILFVSFGMSNYLWSRAYFMFQSIRIILPIFGTILTITASHNDIGNQDSVEALAVYNQIVNTRTFIAGLRISRSSFFTIRSSECKKIIPVVVHNV